MFPLLLFRPIRYRLPIRRPIFPAWSSGSIGGSGDDVIIIGSGVPGPPGPPGPPGSLTVPTNTVQSNYLITADDYFIGVITSASFLITLPLAVEGTVYIVKDVLGTAATNPIIITNTALIDGAINARINVNYGSLTFLFSDNVWNIV